MPGFSRRWKRERRQERTLEAVGCKPVILPGVRILPLGKCEAVCGGAARSTVAARTYCAYRDWWVPDFRVGYIRFQVVVRLAS
jgi:hypothetical protein